MAFGSNGFNITIDKTEVSDDELKYLNKNDPGYVSDKVMDYKDKNYLKSGYHKIDWKESKVEGSENKIVVERFNEDGSPKTLEQWQHPGQKGSYFMNPGTKYEDLQLQDIQEKRELHRYEVVKPFEMEKSLINDQKFVNGQNNEAEQYVPTMTKTVFDEKTNELKEVNLNAEDLVELGYLKEITDPNENSDNDDSSGRNRKDILEDLKNAKIKADETDDPEAKEALWKLRDELDDFDEKTEVNYLTENDSYLSK